MTDMTLTEAIEQLRTELVQAQEQGVKQGLRFAIKEIQVELALVAKTSEEFGGGIKAWFVEASAKAGEARETGHKIIMKLGPAPGVGEFLVSRSQLERE